MRWSRCLKIILTPSCEDKRKKLPKYAQYFKGWLRFLTITSKWSYEFSQFRQCLCFQSRWIYYWHFYWANVCVISKIQVNFRFKRYWWFCLINFWNFHAIHVFEVRESIADTEIPCLGGLENPVRLPVQDVLGGTGDCVLSIFEISSPFMFLRSGNPLLAFLLSYHVWKTSKIQVTFCFKRFLKLPKYSFLDKYALNL